MRSVIRDMDIEITFRDEFNICGYAAETTLDNNDSDISGLIGSVLGSEKEKALLDMQGCKPGWYGLEWYTEGHKSFFYLLGKEVSSDANSPDGALIKAIPPAEYAVAHIPAGASLIGAWTEFFSTAIPASGYTPDYNHGFFFEYYPEGVHGCCELWTPVIKQNG